MNEKELVGVIPAAGLATRLGRLPGSKELLPIGWEASESGALRPKAVCEYLIEALRAAGVRRLFFVIRKGKWDIPEYLGDGSGFGVSIAYLLMGLPHGAPYTVDQAYEFVRGATVALGFPDIIFEPRDAYARLLERHAGSRADVTLGLFPAASPESCDMVDFDSEEIVREIQIKPSRTSLTYTWGIALWAPRFTEFLHAYVRASASGAPRGKEAYVGEAIRAAIQEGLRVEAIPVSERAYIDIGTPEKLSEALAKYAALPGRPRGP